MPHVDPVARRPSARQRYAAQLIQIQDDARDTEQARDATVRDLMAEIGRLRRLVANVPRYLEGVAESHRLDAGVPRVGMSRTPEQQTHLVVAHHLADAARDFAHYAAEHLEDE